MSEFMEQFDKTSDTIGYKCPSCGAPMEFEPSKQALVCEHCGTVREVSLSDEVNERSFTELFESKPWRGDIKVIRCQNCGAREVLDKNEISSTCPFCGSASVLETDELAGIKPDTAIPFKMTEATAKQRCAKWLKSRFFAPSKFKKDLKVKHLNGCYCPVWTFDCNTNVSYSGVLGKHYVETYVVNGKTMTRTKVRYFKVSGNIPKVYDDIYVKGSDAVNEKFLQKIQPFDINDYVKYDDKLLAGFSANHYTVEPITAWSQAEERIRQQMKIEIMSRYNADEVQYLNISLRHNSRSFKYLMLPVYISAVNYDNKLYNQYVNGVSGKVGGKSPLSPLKIAITALLGAAAIVGLVMLLTLL